MKKKIFAVAVIAICLSIFACGSLAYFTAEGTATNIITTGGVDIRVEEFQQTASGLAPYPSQAIAIMPGTTVSKVVTVKNLEARSFIRVSMTLVVKDADGAVLDIPAQELEKVITIAVNTQDWVQKEGDAKWWYCSSIAESGASTAPFIRQVVFDGPAMTNEYQNCTVEVLITAQAVQAANNGETVLEAAGWKESQ